MNADTLGFSFPPHRKDKKKVDKLEAMIPYHEGRRNTEEVEKIKQQVEEIWQKTREAAYTEWEPETATKMLYKLDLL